MPQLYVIHKFYFFNHKTYHLKLLETNRKLLAYFYLSPYCTCTCIFTLKKKNPLEFLLFKWYNAHIDCRKYLKSVFQRMQIVYSSFREKWLYSSLLFLPRTITLILLFLKIKIANSLYKVLIITYIIVLLWQMLAKKPKMPTAVHSMTSSLYSDRRLTDVLNCHFA